MPRTPIALSIIVALSLLVCHGARAGSIDDAYKAQVQRAADALKTIAPLSHAERLRAIAKLPAGTYVNLPEFWRSVSFPSTLTSAYWVLSEPLSTDALDAAERLLPKATGDDRFRMIVALYRYRRPEGAELLRANVRDHKDLMSATLLAASQDRPALPDILATFKAYPENFPLTPCLSTWRDPHVQTALFDAYQANPNNTALAEALATQKFRPALPLLESEYRQVKGYPRGETIVYDANKTILGAILISFGAPEGKALLPAYQKQLSESMHTQTMNPHILTLIRTIGVLQLRDLTTGLNAILQTYSRQSNAESRPWSELVAVSAAASLYACERQKAIPEIQALKRALQANFPHDSYWGEDLDFSLAQIDDASLNPENYLRLKGVRKVPHDFLPSVRSFAISQGKG